MRRPRASNNRACRHPKRSQDNSAELLRNADSIRSQGARPVCGKLRSRLCFEALRRRCLISFEYEAAPSPCLGDGIIARSRNRCAPFATDRRRRFRVGWSPTARRHWRKPPALPTSRTRPKAAVFSGDRRWMGGVRPAADAQGNIYFATGNGPWNGTTNFSMSVLKTRQPRSLPCTVCHPYPRSS